MSSLQVPQAAFPAPNSQQRLSPNVPKGKDGQGSSSRVKVALTPGHSLMDWVRLMNQKGRILNGIGGRLMEVTEEELKKHDKKGDAWTSIAGMVYNITPYLKFHPGGVDELMRAAGKDGTDLFNEYHKWVNFESLLEKCMIGKLKKTFTVPAKKVAPKSKAPSRLLLAPPSSQTQVDGRTGPPKARYDWYQNKDQVVVTIYAKCKTLTKENLIIDQQDRVLCAVLYLEDFVYTLHIELKDEVLSDVKIQIRKGPIQRVDLVLKKANTTQWSHLGDPKEKNNQLKPRKEYDPFFRSCRLVSKIAVTHDTDLMTFDLPKGSQMKVPIGCHVYIQMDVNGTQVNRPYTVILPSLVDSCDETKVNDITLMIKTYPSGSFTPQLSQLKIGDSVDISDYEGSFNEQCLSDASELILLAAGTGFTPMVRLISYALSEPSKKKVLLIFFNKTEEDILWGDQLSSLQSEHKDQLRSVNVLSQASASWEGPRGHVSEELLTTHLKEFEHDKGKSLLCICGPTAFTQKAYKLVLGQGYQEEAIHLFTA